MKLSEMRNVLTRDGIQLTKSLGQNFLHDANQLLRIVDAAELDRSDKVLEIGPGLGPLTELLVERAGEVIAIEKDARLVKVLKERFPANSSAVIPDAGGRAVLQLIHDDALDFLRREPRDWRDWKLVANLPYSVASPILVELARGEQSPRRLVATLQWEVARRLMAGAGDKDYGVLTLLVQLDFEPRETFKIPPGCFFPQPDVDSACIVMTRRETPLIPEAQRAVFVRVVKRAFSQRRKMMMKLLKNDWSVEALQRAFGVVGLSTTIRAEAVAIENLVRLAMELSASAPTPS